MRPQLYRKKERKKVDYMRVVSLSLVFSPSSFLFFVPPRKRISFLLPREITDAVPVGSEQVLHSEPDKAAMIIGLLRPTTKHRSTKCYAV